MNRIFAVDVDDTGLTGFKQDRIIAGYGDVRKFMDPASSIQKKLASRQGTCRTSNR